VDDGIDENSALALAIFQAGLETSGIVNPNLPTKQRVRNDWHGKATSNDLEKARSTLRQFYRDWSEEGAMEREACHSPIIRALEAERDARSKASMKVLVPGAGLGRLVFELCCLGFDTEGNEISWHQLLASSYVLNICEHAKMHTLYPWIHSFSNHKTRANHFRSVRVPDIQPADVLGQIENPGQMSMSASDFLLLYSDEERKDTFDAVATVFFLDTVCLKIVITKRLNDTAADFLYLGPQYNPLH
jgi:carnosine N-methyltransferase